MLYVYGEVIRADKIADTVTMKEKWDTYRVW